LEQFKNNESTIDKVKKENESLKNENSKLIAASKLNSEKYEKA